MRDNDDVARENQALRDRLTRLSQASLRINESLDLDNVLDEVVYSARTLTEARYGGIALVDEAGHAKFFVTSGMTPQEHRDLEILPDGLLYYQALVDMEQPLRLPDFHSFTRGLGLPEFSPPGKFSGALPFLVAPIRRRGKGVGFIFLAIKNPGGEFTPEDEETLVMFASQAGMVIANARRHRDEQRARTDLETLINTSPVGVLVFDVRTGDLVSVNREAERMISNLQEPGRPAKELLDVITVRRAEGGNYPPSKCFATKMLLSGQTVRAEEITIQVPDGRSVSALLNATPVRSDDGTVESFVMTLQDLAPMREIQRLRAEFLGMVSHELRTPLSTIKGSAETLLQESSDLHPAETAQFHRIILDQSNQMRFLIRDLLDVALIETGALPLATEPTSVAVLVDQARTRFLSGGGRHNLHIDLPSDLPSVMADRRRIVQVLDNLLSNAARHSADSSPIRVTAMLEGVFVSVSVADDGAGLPAERLPHLFRKFSRLRGRDGDRNLEGTGLGLAICRGIVEAHGGRIWAESDGPGLGSRFLFNIPAVKETLLPDLHPALGNHTASDRKRILAVDDDPHALKYVRDALTKAGYIPILTGDAEEIGRLMEEEKPHLVLLDLMLPGTDGLELMENFFRPLDVPVIFLSVYGQDEVIARALALGAVDYIVKPFSPTELGARIEAGLRRREAPRPAKKAEEYVLGDLHIHFAKREVTMDGRSVHLTGIEYRMLYELSVHAGQVLPYRHLLREVWGPGNSGDLRPMRTVVRSLRQKLGDDASNPKYISTEARVGYLMKLGEMVGSAS